MARDFFMAVTFKLFRMLKPVCSKKQQKKSQPRNWSHVYGTSRGSECPKVSTTPIMAMGCHHFWIRLCQLNFCQKFPNVF